MRHAMVATALLLAACAEKQSEGLDPGRWEMVQETRVIDAGEGWRGGNPDSRSAFICIDARQAGAPPAELLLGMEAESCSGALDTAGGKVAGELTCNDGTATGRKVVVEGEVGPDRFELRDRQKTPIATGLNVGAGGTSTMTAEAETETRTTARRVGECKGDEVGPPI